MSGQDGFYRDQNRKEEPQGWAHLILGPELEEAIMIAKRFKRWGRLRLRRAIREHRQR